MYKIIKNVIESKDYKLEDILYKISKMYIEDRLTEAEKRELDNLAREKAKAENSYDIQRQLDNIFARLEELEKKHISVEEDEEEVIEEYPEFVQPTGAHDSYNIGDKVTFDDKKYTCIMDNCAWSPEVYPDAWEEVVEDTEEPVAEEISESEGE